MRWSAEAEEGPAAVAAAVRTATSTSSEPRSLAHRRLTSARRTVRSAEEDEEGRLRWAWEEAHRTGTQEARPPWLRRVCRLREQQGPQERQQPESSKQSKDPMRIVRLETSTRQQRGQQPAQAWSQTRTRATSPWRYLVRPLRRT